ncbi:MAG: 50S ribosomal protein L13 [Candidatus Portiera sp.]|nr:50S ribosomal protein L13 [Portiera sp.]
MKSYYPKGKIENKWFLVDAAGAITGRLASKIAIRLRGKYKPEYTPGVDMGDGIIVINAEKVTFTGNKLTQKEYYSHSGYPGALKTVLLEDKLKKKPEEVLYLAVKGMLPRGPLGRVMLTRLKIYAKGEHPHSAQTPALLEL